MAPLCSIHPLSTLTNSFCGPQNSFTHQAASLCIFSGHKGASGKLLRTLDHNGTERKRTLGEPTGDGRGILNKSNAKQLTLSDMDLRRPKGWTG